MTQIRMEMFHCLDNSKQQLLSHAAVSFWSAHLDCWDCTACTGCTGWTATHVSLAYLAAFVCWPAGMILTPGLLPKFLSLLLVCLTDTWLSVNKVILHEYFHHWLSGTRISKANKSFNIFHKLCFSSHSEYGSSDTCYSVWLDVLYWFESPMLSPVSCLWCWSWGRLVSTVAADASNTGNCLWHDQSTLLISGKVCICLELTWNELSAVVWKLSTNFLVGVWINQGQWCKQHCMVIAFTAYDMTKVLYFFLEKCAYVWN